MPVADLIICMMQLTLGQPGCNRASKRMGCRYPTSYLVKRKCVPLAGFVAELGVSQVISLTSYTRM